MWKMIIDIVRPRFRDFCYGIILKKIPFGYHVIKYNMYLYNMSYRTWMKIILYHLNIP